MLLSSSLKNGYVMSGEFHLKIFLKNVLKHCVLGPHSKEVDPVCMHRAKALYLIVSQVGLMLSQD